MQHTPTHAHQAPVTTNQYSACASIFLLLSFLPRLFYYLFSLDTKTNYLKNICNLNSKFLYHHTFCIYKLGLIDLPKIKHIHRTNFFFKMPYKCFGKNYRNRRYRRYVVVLAPMNHITSTNVKKDGQDSEMKRSMETNHRKSTTQLESMVTKIECT